MYAEFGEEARRAHCVALAADPELTHTPVGRLLLAYFLKQASLFRGDVARARLLLRQWQSRDSYEVEKSEFDRGDVLIEVSDEEWSESARIFLVRCGWEDVHACAAIELLLLELADQGDGLLKLSNTSLAVLLALRFAVKFSPKDSNHPGAGFLW